MIGPGRLILVVGPSGAGKDTLLAGARLASIGDHRIVFPRRVVTRQGGAAEDHDTLDPADFDRAAARGAFSLSWEAHGLKYGIPAALDDHIASARIALCNVSRAIVPQARARYAHVCVVLVTAPPQVLAERLATRARDSDGSLEQRLQRKVTVPDLRPDVTIENAGDVVVGIRRLVDVIASGQMTGGAGDWPKAQSTL